MKKEMQQIFTRRRGGFSALGVISLLVGSVWIGFACDSKDSGSTEGAQGTTGDVDDEGSSAGDGDGSNGSGAAPILDCLEEDYLACQEQAGGCTRVEASEVMPTPDGSCVAQQTTPICLFDASGCALMFVTYRHLETGRCFVFPSDCRLWESEAWGNDSSCPQGPGTEFPVCQ